MIGGMPQWHSPIEFTSPTTLSVKYPIAAHLDMGRQYTLDKDPYKKIY